MADDLLNYPKLVERAMRGVVREALSIAADHGLSGEHHFYVSFDTQAAGVEMPAVLRAQYPDEMTIVLQHRFWDLEVDDIGFGVTLSFGGAKQRLYVPYDALAGFVDPSVNFGFKFDAEAVAAAPEAPAADTAPDAGEQAEQPAPEADGSAEVVTLDSFRKK